MVYIPLTWVGMGKSREIGALAKELGGRNCLIVTDRGVVKAGLIETIGSSLKKAGCAFDVFDRCKPHAPSGVIEECLEVAKRGAYDLLIGVGGGSVMDTAKAVSVLVAQDMRFHDLIQGRVKKKGLPKILVPTTAGTGSEWSRTGVYYDETEQEERLVIESPLFADAVIIDPELTRSLPPKVTADSGMDALTHAIEAYTNATPNILSDLLAEASIKMIARHLRSAYRGGDSLGEARYKLSLAAAMAMSAIAMNGAGLAHFLNPPIVKKAQIPHGEACFLMLPRTMEFNLEARTARYAAIARWMGEEVEARSPREAARQAIEAVEKIGQEVGMPRSLREVGITERDIPEMVEATIKNFQSRIEAKNPRKVTREDLFQLYRTAL